MAPEQLTGGAVTPATDIYGLGVLMYELTTGQLPFAGDTPQEVASERARSPPPEPRRVAAELSNRWNQTTRWCLSTEPAQRPQSAELVIQALLGERAVGGRRMRSAWVVAALALPGGAVVRGLALAASGDRPPAPGPRGSPGSEPHRRHRSRLVECRQCRKR